MSRLRALLMVLVVVRLLMPPGVCACEWSAPAARVLAGLLDAQPAAPAEEDGDDDHAPGCPASPLAVGMGVRPPSEPLLPPALSLDLPSQPGEPVPSAPADWVDPFRPDESPPAPRYLTLRTLLL